MDPKEPLFENGVHVTFQRLTDAVWKLLRPSEVILYASPIVVLLLHWMLQFKSILYIICIIVNSFSAQFFTRTVPQTLIDKFKLTEKVSLRKTELSKSVISVPFSKRSVWSFEAEFVFGKNRVSFCLNSNTEESPNSHIFVRPKKRWLFGYVWQFG